MSPQPWNQRLMAHPVPHPPSDECAECLDVFAGYIDDALALYESVTHEVPGYSTMVPRAPAAGQAVLDRQLALGELDR